MWLGWKGSVAKLWNCITVAQPCALYYCFVHHVNIITEHLAISVIAQFDSYGPLNVQSGAVYVMIALAKIPTQFPKYFGRDKVAYPVTGNLHDLFTLIDDLIVHLRRVLPCTSADFRLHDSRIEGHRSLNLLFWFKTHMK